MRFTRRGTRWRVGDGSSARYLAAERAGEDGIIAAWLAACELHPEAPVRCVGWTEGEPIGGR
jgi:hypothetical protein